MSFLGLDGFKTFCQLLKGDLDKKVEKENPVAIGSFSLNRKSGSTVGRVSATLGENCEAPYDWCLAGGYESVSSGSYGSLAHGYHALSNTFASTALGLNNKKMNGSTAYPGYDADLFVVGNGTSSSDATRSNALRLIMNGNMLIAGSYSSGGADYAEFAEWLDGNSDEEDRVGYFVTVVGKKIKIANQGEHIFGIVSGDPAVVGNSPEDWQGRWLRDNFRRKIMEDVTITNPETGEKVTVKRPVENPEYDSTQQYVDRANRKEYDYVGWIGVLPVRDDGTCQVDACCMVADGGIATSAEKGYRVLERVSENVVEIEFTK